MAKARLTETPEGLQVELAQLKRPFTLSFEGALDRRARQGGELLWRATGAARPEPPLILDATAGLCRDAYLLAAGGAQVVAFEREPLLYQLVHEALNRSSSSITDRLSLLSCDAQETLGALKSGALPSALEALSLPLPFGVIYLDPMFPTRQKSAAVSREAQVLQALTHSLDHPEPLRLAEERSLLELALACAHYRVVVKRPIKAPPLEGPRPSAALKGRVIRYDIYGLRSLRTPGAP